MVPCSEKIWISSFGSIFDDSRAELWIHGLILDFLENGCKDFAHIGNLDETNDYLSNVGGPVF